jgi:hypothetical protein
MVSLGCPAIHVPESYFTRSLLAFLSPCFGFLMFLLGFISSLFQLAWEKGFDVAIVMLKFGLPNESGKNITMNTLKLENFCRICLSASMILES